MRLLPLTAATTVQCSEVPHTATQQHSNTATQQHSNTATQQHSNTATQQCTLSTTHCRQRRSESNMHTDPQTRSAAATHSTTLHTQRARYHGSNTQRRRGIAHPPTTPSSGVQRSHSRRHTQHFHHGVTVAVGSYTTAMRHRAGHKSHWYLARTALPLQRSGNARVYAAQRDAHTRAINR